MDKVFKLVFVCIGQTLLFIACCIMPSHAQDSNVFPGIPVLTNYSSEIYGGGPRSYIIQENSSGYLYISNDAGLLVFDGIHWSLYPLLKNEYENQTKPYSIRGRGLNKMLIHEEKIFLGGQRMFGYYFKDQNGAFRYTDLSQNLIKQSTEFKELKSLVLYENALIVLTDQGILRYLDDNFESFESNVELDFIEIIEGKMLGYSDEAGLFIYSAGKFRKMNGTDVLRNENIHFMISYKAGQLLLANPEGQIFLYDGEYINLWKSLIKDGSSNAELRCGAKVSEDLFAFGLSKGGVQIFDLEGQFKYSIDRNAGLPNEHILDLHASPQNRLWLTSWNGISALNIQSPIQSLELEQFNGYPGQFAHLEDNDLYLNTGNILFYGDLNQTTNDQKQMRRIPEIDKDVLQLKPMGEELWVSTESNVFRLSKEEVTRIPFNQKVYDYLPLTGTDQLLIGSDRGIHLYEKEGNRWSYANPIDTSLSVCHAFYQDVLGHVWYEEEGKEVGRVFYNEQFDLYELKPVPGRKPMFRLFPLQNSLIAKGPDGFYRHDPGLDQLTPYQDLDQFFDSDEEVFELKEGPDEHLWFISNKNVGVLKITDTGLRKEINKISFPSIISSVVRGRESIFPVGNNRAIYNTNKGFVQINLDQFIGVKPPQVSLNSVVSMNPQNKTSFFDLSQSEWLIDTSAAQETRQLFTIPNNTLRFYFNSDQSQDIVFSTKLEGLEQDWAEWNSEKERLFTSLSPGEYALLLKSRSPNNMESLTIRYPFKVQRQIYLTTPALISYGVLLTLLILLLYRSQVKRVKKHSHQLKSEQENLEEKIKEIKDSSEEELKKTKQEGLDSSLKPMIKSSQPMRRIQEKMQNLELLAEDQDVQREIKKVQKYIRHSLNFDDEWLDFSRDFNAIHENILDRLKEEYPDLTEKELRLCACVKMGLKSKEIGPLLNITERGVEVSRYRLRKKMRLEAEMKLKDFLDEF